MYMVIKKINLKAIYKAENKSFPYPNLLPQR